MSYTAQRGRLDEDARGSLASWAAAHIAPRGHEDFQISDVSAPNAGYSGKTVFLTASWTSPNGQRTHRDLVLRMQAPDHQLFMTPDAIRQAEVIRRLGRHRGVPMPNIVAQEPDPEVLGAPFYLMDRVHGRIPSDVPSWHKAGWTADLAADERELLYDNALRTLVAVHRITDPGDIGALAAPGPGSAIARYLDSLRRWYSSSQGTLLVDPELLAAAFAELVENMPATTAEGIVWGDARVGNMSFADDLSVAALFDWEGATTGPPEVDLGWWLMFERFLCESIGLHRPDGVPDDQEIVRRYERLGGRLTGDISYYTLLAAFVLTLITNQLAALLIRDGLEPAIAHTYPTVAAELIRRYLDERIEQRSSAR